ncbi:hypothetical protein V500_02288 [Pseudogymnoascus sp. VKM F-4518 (FW-2643)]|nr:hypothetical protein V500_02288 [Pseudogymnoascus sp. VKM F-4518 (FW-2643)]
MTTDDRSPSKTHHHICFVFQGASPDLAIQAVETGTAAFPLWAQTPLANRREILLDVAKVLRQKHEPLSRTKSCSPVWSHINLEDAVGPIEETVAFLTDLLTGAIPPTHGDSYALVFKEPDAAGRRCTVQRRRDPPSQPLSEDELEYPATIIEGLTPDMHYIESFGPIYGIVVVDSELEALQMVKSSAYGLSAAIFTQNRFNALNISREIRAAAHVNSLTVHDEPTLPHGGHGDSGWGRFGARWGLDEFLHERTVILNKYIIMQASTIAMELLKDHGHCSPTADI